MNEKKRLHLLKLETFLATSPCVLYFQYQPMSLAQWSVIKKRIHDIGGVQLLMVKNSMVDTFVAHYAHTGGISSRGATSGVDISTFPSLAGPGFFVGCRDTSQITLVMDAFRGYPTILCVGGVYANSTLTHLDVAALMRLDASVYPSLMSSFGAADRLCGALQEGIALEVNRTSGRLLQCLAALAVHRAGVPV